MTLRLGTFASRFIKFPEVRLERIDTNKWVGTLDLTVKGFKTVSTSVTAVDGRVRALTFNMGDAAVLPGTLRHAGSVTLRLDKGNEQLSGRGTLETQRAVRQELPRRRGLDRARPRGAAHVRDGQGRRDGARLG